MCCCVCAACVLCAVVCVLLLLRILTMCRSPRSPLSSGSPLVPQSPDQTELDRTANKREDNDAARKRVSDCSNSHKISSASRQSFVHDTPCCVKCPSDNRWRHRKLRHRLSKHRLACYVLLCVLCVQYVLLCALLHVLCAGRRGLRCRRGRRYRRGRQIVD